MKRPKTASERPKTTPRALKFPQTRRRISRKSGLPGPKNAEKRPKTPQKRPKTTKNPPKTAKKHPKTTKKRPKTAKIRKMRRWSPRFPRKFAVARASIFSIPSRKSSKNTPKTAKKQPKMGQKWRKRAENAKIRNRRMRNSRKFAAKSTQNARKKSDPKVN
jgi:hypothetical protein